MNIHVIVYRTRKEVEALLIQDNVLQTRACTEQKKEVYTTLQENGIKQHFIRRLLPEITLTEEAVFAIEVDPDVFLFDRPPPNTAWERLKDLRLQGTPGRGVKALLERLELEEKHKKTIWLEESVKA